MQSSNKGACLRRNLVIRLLDYHFVEGIQENKTTIIFLLFQAYKISTLELSLSTTYKGDPVFSLTTVPGKR